MSAALIVGMIDSGIDAGLRPRLLDGARFAAAADGAVNCLPMTEDRHGHGSEVAGIICAQAPGVRLLVAQVFNEQGRTSAAVVAAALHWLCARGARLVNLSIGLREDRAVLRQACAAAQAGGALLLASVPAQGGVVYPAWYPQVIRVIGDRRCGPGQLTALRGVAHFGASPLRRDATPGGSSLAVAQVTGVLAAAFAADPECLDRDSAIGRLQRGALAAGNRAVVDMDQLHVSG